MTESLSAAFAAELLRTYGSPLYVYDEATIRERCRRLRAALALPGIQILYAMKANANPEILRVVREEGLGIDAVSLGEVALARRCGFAPEEISYNGNNVDDAEMQDVVRAGVHVSVDGLDQLERFGRLRLGESVGLRLNPDVGAGHHDHVITGGPEAKFGVPPAAIPEALAIARRHGCRVDGLQQHIGSGILDAETMLLAVDVMLANAAGLPDLQFVDFGGGIGIPYKPADRPIDLSTFGSRVAGRLGEFRRRLGREVRFRFEPGRFVVAESGTLLVTVTAVKRGERHVFVGTDSGFNHLVRPVMYGSWHEIRNVTNPGGTPVPVSVAGNICESGDLFAKDRPIAEPRAGDVLAIANTGAYGYSMASTYNQRARPAEVMVLGGAHRLIRRRETLADLWATFA